MKNLFLVDWVVIKTDSLGNKQWCKDLGGTQDESENGSILAADDGYYLVSSTGSTDHDCTDTVWHMGINTANDYYILKLDVGGNVLWDSSYGGSGDDNVYYAMFDNRDSTIVITGGTQSNDYMVTGYHGGGDMWVIKVNKDGTLLWQKAFGTPSPEIGNAICPATNGGYMLLGGTNGVIGQSDAWVINIDNAGNEVTEKVFGGTGIDRPYSIVSYLDGYAVLGLSGSAYFTDGTTYGNFDTSSINPDGGGAFVSYVSYWPLSVNSIAGLPKSSLIQFPNPAQDKVTVLLKDININGYLTITNSIGQVFYSSTINSKQEQVNIITTGWTKGLYLVRWQSDDGKVLTGKLIIN